MNELPKIVRARLGVASASDHPDPDLLNAFAEQALQEDERQQVLAHLSACADCREVIALATSSAQATKATPSIDTGTPHSWFHWKIVRWGAAVACLVIVGSAVLMKRDSLMKPARVETAASQEAPVADRRSYDLADSSPSPDAAHREDAAINTAMRPPSTQLTTQNRARLAEKPAPPKSATAAPNAGLSGNKVAGNLVSGVAGAPARSNLSPAAPAAFSNAVTTPAQNESKSLAVQTRKVTDMSVPAASEMVEVEAGAPAVETSAALGSGRDKKEAFGKAKPAPAPVQLDQLAESTTEAASPNKDSKVASQELLSKARHEQLVAANPPVSRWTISSDGQLQHSTDSGKTWQPVPVADQATFRALSANGPDVWVGGPAGLLYHSTDSGAYWVKVQPNAAGTILNADIAAIEFTDIRHGKISTANGEIWLTENAGQSWRKQP